ARDAIVVASPPAANICSLRLLQKLVVESRCARRDGAIRLVFRERRVRGKGRGRYALGSRRRAYVCLIRSGAAAARRWPDTPRGCAHGAAGGAALPRSARPAASEKRRILSQDFTRRLQQIQR